MAAQPSGAQVKCLAASSTPSLSLDTALHVFSPLRETQNPTPSRCLHCGHPSPHHLELGPLQRPLHWPGSSPAPAAYFPHSSREIPRHGNQIPCSPWPSRDPCLTQKGDGLQEPAELAHASLTLALSLLGSSGPSLCLWAFALAFPTGCKAHSLPSSRCLYGCCLLYPLTLLPCCIFFQNRHYHMTPQSMGGKCV